MKNSPFYLILLLLLSACGEVSPKGDLESKEVPIESFKTLELDGKFRVFYVRNSANEIYIETYGNFIKNLDISQNDGALSIKEKRETKGGDFYNITIFSSSVPTSIEVGDQVELSISGAIKGESLALKLKDQAKFIGALEFSNTSIDMSSLARANFSGSSNLAQIKIQDTAHIIAPYFEIGTLKLEAQNGPYVEVHAVDTLKGEIKNTTKLLYYNTPTTALKKESTVQVEQKQLN
ncbi:GIN domain-containing protein [Chryseobacterium sp. A301]